jgi:sugar O-acyltransferase (sialic acid O-acetyltransferase NeuD family)
VSDNSKIALLVIGTGGHANSLIDVIECLKCFEIKGVIAKEHEGKGYSNGYPIIGEDKDFEHFQNLGFSFAIGVGQIKSYLARKGIFDHLLTLNASLPNIVSPYARISPKAQLEIGISILHDVVISSNVSIGSNCIINTKVLIEHDATVGANTHVSTGAILNGNVKVGENCFIGSGVVIANGVSICNDVTIGAGAVVIRDIEIAGIYVGNPLRYINKI